jgi:DNA (cytosine-5)-methyltransferase 1
MTTSYLTVTDQFCGAGGSSIGAVAAGAELKLALNHWQLAIETHNTNFPNAAHDCTDIQACDPRRYPSTDILITSPECTNHSLAKGIKRPAQGDLFGAAPDPAEERSRATLWDVPRFADVHKYRAIIVENVVDARQWVNWTAWLLAMRQLGYDYKTVYYNSMFAYPTPQSRDRMYIVFWKKGNKAPDLDILPPAWCAKCSQDVSSVQSWKPGKRWGKYNQQYTYCCPVCASIVLPYYYCAASAIDWNIPITRIGDRKKPLTDKTLMRIEAGLKKYGSQPMGIDTAYAGARKAALLHESFPTQTARQTMGLTTPPYLMDTIHSGRNGRHQDMVWGVDGPDRTQIGQNTKALVVPPFLMSINHTTDRANSVEGAFPTVMPQTIPAVVTPPGIQITLRGQNAPKGLDEPVDTVAANGNHHALLVPYYGHGNASADYEPVTTVTTHERHALAIPPFLLGYYTRQQAAVSGLDEAMPTQSTQPRHYLVEPQEIPDVEDCGFRMLQPKEIKAAMAFPQEYKIQGNKREQVKQLGNAVTPPVMGILMERVVATFR